MRLATYISIALVFSILLPPQTHGTSKSLHSLQSPSLQIKERNPVVNEGNQIRLTAIDSNGQPVPGVTFESGSPDIVSVNSQGMVTGIKQGFATVTAREGSM